VRLTLIGYWLGNFAAGWPKAEDFVDTDWSPEERQGVVAWLEFWPRVRISMGYSSCRLCGQRNGVGESSDGTFIWPDGLAHYVRDHGVRLPRTVVEHALSQPLIDRPRLEPTEPDDTDVDYEWWRMQSPDWSHPQVR
jgi:hypothetical protein